MALFFGPEKAVSLGWLAHSLGGKTFFLTVTGVILVDFEGQAGSNWHRDDAQPGKRPSCAALKGGPNASGTRPSRQGV